MRGLRIASLVGILAALVISTVSCNLLGSLPGQQGGASAPGAGPGGAAGAPRQRPAVPVNVAAVTQGSISSVLSYAGSIQARAQVNVVPRTAGRLDKVRVDVGSPVKAGDIIAELDHFTLDAQVRQAEANLMSAEARLSTLSGGGRYEDVASAAAALDAARARFEVVKRGATSADLQASRSAVTAAQSRLERARADLARLKAPLSQDELAGLRATVDRTAVAVQRAQAEYDRVAFRPDLGATTQAAALQQATIDYQAALANFNVRTAGPRAEDLATAEKAVTSAEADLASAQARLDQVAAGPSEEDLTIAESAVLQAENQLAVRRNPYTEQDVRSAQAQIAVAQAAVEVAKAQRAEAFVVAPFDGIVAQRFLAEGALATQSAPIVSLVSNDVEVAVSVEEASIARFQTGQSVSLSVSAYPGESFAGKVSSVSPTADARTHTFMIKVVPDQRDGKLRIGMFAEARVTAAQKATALLLTKEAVFERDGKSHAFAVADGKASLRELKLGLVDEKNVEIIGGLAAGDQVVIAGGTNLNDGDSVRVANQPDQPGQQRPGMPGKPGATEKPGERPGTPRKSDQGSGTQESKPGQ
ncbi:MAG: efflux RND transporter periplasmic adaptor subunit [Chloroflexi bacterium]|nr:efflux RND transporter periplasmic adaptor subunit [Chloroflexota bacterium]